MQLSHIDKNNKPMMVDVGDKSPSFRTATACGTISMSKQAFDMVCKGQAKKGPVITTAVVAAIMGAKQTSTLIPMCHPLMLSNVNIECEEISTSNSFKLIAKVKCEGKTGVEMEALTAVSVGLLTIYDMIKAVDKTMLISDIVLLSKEGGKSGTYTRG